MNRNIFYSLFYLKNLIVNPIILKNVKETWQNQYISEEKITEIQTQKLKKILLYAYNYCPYYRKVFFESGFHPEQFKEIKDIERIPLLTKKDIKENLNSIVAINIDDIRKEEVFTSGTTGMPLKIFRDKNTASRMTALYLRTIKNFGCNIGAKTAWIWGLRKEDEYLDFRNKNFKLQFLKNTTWFNAFDMNDESMYSFAEFSFHFKPELIIGYVSSLYEYAKFIQRNNIKIFSPKAIWITAEPADNNQRELIESMFNCQVYSQYGSSEILHIAYECRFNKNLHIHADSRFVEITDESGKSLSAGEIGNVVITDLENYVMPIIRYKNDDMSSFAKFKCNCGINFPTIGPVIGRTYNIFKLKNGKQIYGHMFSKKLFNYVKEIKQFKVHQKTYDKIDVLIVPGEIIDRNKLINELLSYFKYYTGDEVEYTFKFVDEISREKSGKFLYTKSDII